jgi:hypothetical protein
MDNSDWIAPLVAFIILFSVGVVNILIVQKGKDRIYTQLEKKGAKDILVSWEPFNIYWVEYVDASGGKHKTHCKIDYFGFSIYWADEG